MFHKNSEKLKSFLGSESEFQGDLVTKGILRMDGIVQGKIQADQVIVSETSVIKGEIIAKRIVVGGRVEGCLRGQEIVEITANGKVTGDVFTNKLLVMEGAEFNGRIEMKAEQNVFEFDAKGKGVSAS
jgi:cytoskeletal protein CcmA (bactofilin family)